jgi:hypothetical protein
MKREPSAWGYNWATLFLGDIDTATWPSRLGESRIWDTKIWLWVPRDSDLRITALARASSNFKRRIPSLVGESAPHQQTCNCLTVIKMRYWAPDGWLTPRQTGRLTVDRNITLTWIRGFCWRWLEFKNCWVSVVVSCWCYKLVAETGDISWT